MGKVKAFLRTVKNVLIALCVIYTAISLALVASTMVPPYGEGQCLMLPEDPVIVFKIIENHKLERSSTVEVDNIVQKADGEVPFTNLRATPFKKVRCRE